MPLSRDNHYVPVWYQKRFLSSGKASLHYLDLQPDIIELPDGQTKQKRSVHYPFSPSQCFYRTDLYSTFYGGFINDEIERKLFGNIDTKGKNAVEAMASQDFSKLSKYFQEFFEYMDMQKIRTPKGLAWLSSKYPSLTQNQLLREMQMIRSLHCVMWFEAVREIVSASKADVKFLLSDHPVTVYNYACPPVSHESDPRVELQATQTIFPLDRDKCIIFTNLDYAQNPDMNEPKTNRPNAVPFRSPLGRFDTTICKRELSNEEVSQINYIIKHRAQRFLAAEEKEWLYPEKQSQYQWDELRTVLLPPKSELYHFGGEVYVGFEDGSTAYRDQYGRTEKVPSYLKKEPRKGKIGANEACPCGSGKKYKKCCRDKPHELRPSTKERSIRERTLMLITIITNMLELEKKDWDTVRREFTDKKIVDIHNAIACLWPPTTDFMSLLPKPDSNVLRAVYTGILDPRLIHKSIAGFSLFVDELIVMSPFMNPNIIRKEYNPVDNPQQYRQRTLAYVLFLIQLAPLIEQGKVILIPDPGDFDSGLRTTILKEAEARGEKVKLNDEIRESLEQLTKDDAFRFMLTLPERFWRGKLKEKNPDMTEEDVDKTIAYMKKMRESDPLSTLQDVEDGKSSGEMIIMSMSPNFELAMFLAQATGAIIYTDHPFRWREIASAIEYYYGEYGSEWAELENALSDKPVDVIYFLESNQLMEAQSDGNLGHYRNALKRIWQSVLSEGVPSGDLIKSLILEIEEARKKMTSAHEKILQKCANDETQSVDVRPVCLEGKLSFRIAPRGHSSSTVYRLLLGHAGHDHYLKTMPMIAYLEHGDVQNEELNGKE